MAVRTVLEYPHPQLRTVCEPVVFSNGLDPAVKALIMDMVDTLYAHPGAVGLAAPQIGHTVRLLVMDATAKTTQEGRIIMINPEITMQSQWKFGREGCLSFPDYLVTVKRARRVTATWQTIEGPLETAAFRDFEAVILQHELDHLNGILFLDRVRNLETDLMARSAIIQRPLPKADMET